MSIRELTEDLERRTLSEYAALSAHSRGRQVPEEKCPIRTEFQRDRDRIIHASKAFRRLAHKTQVFLSPQEDHYRTRLSHTLEVAQIARTIAKSLRLNEELTEAIALAHDLGHAPFGHAGEEALDAAYHRYDPQAHFRHHEQSLRVVDHLEKGGAGLNLTQEVREGIIAHAKGQEDLTPVTLGGGISTLEAGVVRISDRIAYVNHDIDDAVRAGIIRDEDIPGRLVRTLGRWHASRIDRMVEDVVKASLRCDLERIAMTKEIMEAVVDLREFLYQKVYFSPRARDEVEKAKKVLSDLYRYVLDHPAEFLKPYPREDSVERRAADFIAGMTDLYALALFERLFFPRSQSY